MYSNGKKVEEAICLDCNVLKLPQVTLIGLSGGVGRGGGGRGGREDAKSKIRAAGRTFF